MNQLVLVFYSGAIQFSAERDLKLTRLPAIIFPYLAILFYVSSQASSRLYWRENAHAASQLSTRYQTASIKQESSEEKPTGKKISTLYFLC